MSRKYILPVLACLGLFFALFMVFYGMRTPPRPEIIFSPPIPPYTHYVAGVGTVEAASEDIRVGAPFNEVVTAIFVEVGERVAQGSPLFQLDTQTLEAQYREAGKKRSVALTTYRDKSLQLSLYESLKDRSAVSKNEWNQVYYAAQSAYQQVEALEATMDVIASKIERSTVRAPIEGQALQINVHVGETVTNTPFDTKAYLLFGQTDPLHIRVEIDEDDIWRVEKGALATAFVRGNSSLQTPLEFLYIKPFITPKTALSGDNQERVDTRVLQVVYKVKRKGLPIYPGQLLDVYIKGLPADEQF